MKPILFVELEESSSTEEPKADSESCEDVADPNVEESVARQTNKNGRNTMWRECLLPKTDSRSQLLSQSPSGKKLWQQKCAHYRIMMCGKLVEPPKNRKLVVSKWVFKVKTNEDGEARPGWLRKVSCR